MELNIQNAKIELIQWLTTLEDLGTIEKLIAFRKAEAQDLVYELSEPENQSISEGLEDLKKGDVVPHEEAKKVYEKWL